ncbi:hypothetical protein [Phenylobacterium sp. J367]|uniref:hypothetical protein n=1 Tax=Phenylobacterium sp. J367 TaxID=2898435 RepID=UPI002151D503|nr:hypothetical protein [Phenylobacterium sp. J367]MCR5881237.1 hypothetical protein [Phenylobacterium sp. J367]
MSKFDQFKAKLRPGQTYRRADLAQWSTAVDRHLKEAVQAGVLTKLAGGLYYAPKQTPFGKAPPEDDTLVSTFLKGGPFLLASPNAYNMLGVGTTQLQNRTVVYNHKRHGKFTLGGRTYDFRMKPAFPKKLSPEFLLVDLVNNLDQLGESAYEVLERVKARLAAGDRGRVKKAAQTYGSERAKKFFARALAEVGMQDAA